VKYLAAIVPPETNPLLPEWSELIIGFIAFLIVFGMLGKVLMPRISKALQERTDAIEGGLRRAEDAQAEADRTLDRYKAQLAEARHEAARLRAEAEARGAQIIGERREQAEAEFRRITEAARAQIEADRQQAIQSLRGEVGALSVQLASKIVGESLEDEARQRRTVDRFLADLEGRAADGTAPDGAAPDGGVKATR
jgi:F-type H+-transporting ATPase subunit b